ncbi:MAG: hypothetical protein R3B54_03250 [Bdellovibrionota bacterium]
MTPHGRHLSAGSERPFRRGLAGLLALFLLLSTAQNRAQAAAVAQSIDHSQYRLAPKAQHWRVAPAVRHLLPFFLPQAAAA